MKKIKLIIIGLVTCFTLQAQNVMQLSSKYQAGNELNIETVYNGLNSPDAVTDTLYRYMTMDKTTDYLKITHVINNMQDNLINDLMNENYAQDPLELIFGEIIIHKVDIIELALRLKNQQRINEGNYDYAVGDNISLYDIARNKSRSATIEAMPANTASGDVVVRINGGLHNVNKYLIK